MPGLPEVILVSVACTTRLPFWYPEIVEPTAWIFHTSDAGVTVRALLCFSKVQLVALSIRHSDTVLGEFPYHRK